LCVAREDPCAQVSEVHEGSAERSQKKHGRCCGSSTAGPRSAGGSILIQVNRIAGSASVGILVDIGHIGRGASRTGRCVLIEIDGVTCCSVIPCVRILRNVRGV